MALDQVERRGQVAVDDGVGHGVGQAQGEQAKILVLGGGPAGLRAETALAAQHAVHQHAGGFAHDALFAQTLGEDLDLVTGARQGGGQAEIERADPAPGRFGRVFAGQEGYAHGDP